MKFLFSIGAPNWQGYREGCASVAAAIRGLGHSAVVVSNHAEDVEWFRANGSVEAEPYALAGCFARDVDEQSLLSAPGLDWANMGDALRTCAGTSDAGRSR